MTDSGKRIGFLSFRHWLRLSGSQVATARDALVQTVELAVAAEELGLDGAYVRVHHFARQLASPFPLLSAMAARMRRIEIGTGVIDMRHENPLYLAEEAAATDLLADGRLQLGSAGEALRRHCAGRTRSGTCRRRVASRRTGRSTRRARSSLRSRARLSCTPTRGGARAAGWPSSRSRPVCVTRSAGGGHPGDGRGAAQQGMDLMSSTLLSEDTGVPFDELQAEQIERYRAAWPAAGHASMPRVSVSRSVLPMTNDEDRQLLGDECRSTDQVGLLEGVRSRFGTSYAGEPDQIAEELARDAAVREADTLLLTVPNMLGVAHDARLLERW